jgi:hypothetical protein
MKFHVSKYIISAGSMINSNGNNKFYKDYLNKIVDVTIAYPEGKPLDLGIICTGWRKPCVTHVHYRVFDSKEVIK